MAVKVVQIHGRLYSRGYNPNEKNDCIAFRMYGNDANTVEMSFPFHQDTPNLELTIPEALDLRNAIDQLLDIKMLEKSRGNQ